MPVEVRGPGLSDKHWQHGAAYRNGQLYSHYSDVVAVTATCGKPSGLRATSQQRSRQQQRTCE